MTDRKNKARIIKRAAVVTLVIILLLSVINLIAAKFIYDAIFPRFDTNEFYEARYPSYEEIKEDYPRREVGFLSGENRLQGYVYGQGDKGIVVISPGLSSGAGDYIGITMSLVDYGWRVFAFDPTGCFYSEGDSSVGFAQAILDLEAVLEYIKSDKELRALDLFIFGHSRGGYAAACVLESGFDVKGVVTVSGANSSMEITIDTAKNYIGNFAYFGYPALYAYQSFIFGTELTGVSAAEVISNSDCAAMIIQGADDNNTPADTCSIYAHRDEILNPNAEFVLITSDHRSGHTSLMYSRESAMYQKEIITEYDELNHRYPDGIPDKVEDKFLTGIDDMKACEADSGLMADINEFMEKAKAG